MKDHDQKRQNSRDPAQSREEKQNKRSEDRIRHPFDPGWLDRLPTEDHSPYRPWWVVDDPWPKPPRPNS
jgi:hypothetical protein